MLSRLLAPLAPWLIGVSLAAVAALWLYAGHQRDRAEKAEARADTATRQARVSDATSKAVDQVLRTEVVIRDRTERRVDAVQAAPGADDPVPPSVLHEWRNALHELRNPDAEPPRQGS